MKARKDTRVLLAGAIGIFLLALAVQALAANYFSPSRATGEGPVNNVLKYVDLFSGSASLTVPIYTLQSRNGLSFPISISYSSQLAYNTVNSCIQNSSVGLGWELNVPYIMADVNHPPDEGDSSTTGIWLPPYGTNWQGPLHYVNGINSVDLINVGINEWMLKQYGYEKVRGYSTGTILDSIDIVQTDGTIYRFSWPHWFVACDTMQYPPVNCTEAGHSLTRAKYLHYQSNANYRWDLSFIISPWGDALKFEYSRTTEDVVSVSVNNGQCVEEVIGSFTKRNQLTKISETAPWGTEVRFGYADCVAGCDPDPYDGHLEPDEYQETNGLCLLRSVTAVNQGVVVALTKLVYTGQQTGWIDAYPSNIYICGGLCEVPFHSFLRNVIVCDPADTASVVKRLPSTDFDYWDLTITSYNYPRGLLQTVRSPAGEVAYFKYLCPDSYKVERLATADHYGLVFDTALPPHGEVNEYDCSKYGLSQDWRTKDYTVGYNGNHRVVHYPTRMADSDSTIFGFGYSDFEFESDGQLKRRNDFSTNGTLTGYVDYEYLNKQIVGDVIFDPATRILKVTDSSIVSFTQYTYNGNGQVATIDVSDGGKTQYTYACESIAGMGPTGTHQLTAVSEVREGRLSGGTLVKKVFYFQPFVGKGYVPEYVYADGTSGTRISYTYNNSCLPITETNESTGAQTTFYYGEPDCNVCQSVYGPRYLTATITETVPGKAYVKKMWYDWNRGLLVHTLEPSEWGANKYIEYDDFGVPVLSTIDKWTNGPLYTLSRYSYGYSRKVSQNGAYDASKPNWSRKTTYLPDGDSVFSISYVDWLGREIQTIDMSPQDPVAKKYVTNKYYNELGSLELVSKPYPMKNNVDTLYTKFGLLDSHFNESCDGWAPHTGGRLVQCYGSAFISDGGTIMSPWLPGGVQANDTICVELNAYWFPGKLQEAFMPAEMDNDQSKGVDPPPADCSGSDSSLVKVKLWTPGGTVVERLVYVCPTNRKISVRLPAGTALNYADIMISFLPDAPLTRTCAVDDILVWKTGTDRGPQEYSQTYYERTLNQRPVMTFAPRDPKPITFSYVGADSGHTVITTKSQLGTVSRTLINRAGAAISTTALNDTVQTANWFDTDYHALEMMTNPSANSESLKDPFDGSNTMVRGEFRNHFTSAKMIGRTNLNNGELFYSYWPNGSLGRIWEIQNCEKASGGDLSYKVKKPIILKYDKLHRLTTLATEQDTSKYSTMLNCSANCYTYSPPGLTTSWGNLPIVTNYYDTSLYYTTYDRCMGRVSGTKVVNHFRPPDNSFDATWTADDYKVMYTYDRFGRETMKTVNPFSTKSGTLMEGTDTLRVRYEYDWTNRTSTITYPNNDHVNGITVDYEYDKWSRLKVVKVGGVKFAEYSRDSLGRITSTKYYGADAAAKLRDSISYDTRGLVHARSFRAIGANSPADSFTYNYGADRALNSFSRVKYANGTDIATYRNDLDSLGRLIRDSSSAYDLRFTYDQMNNCLTRKNGTQNPTTFHYGYQDNLPCSTGMNWMTYYSGNGIDAANYTYDRFGRVIKITRSSAVWVSFTYNYLDQIAVMAMPNPNLVGDTLKVYYSYDDQGRMVKRMAAWRESEGLLMDGGGLDGATDDGSDDNTTNGTDAGVTTDGLGGGGGGGDTFWHLVTSYHVYDGNQVIWEQYVDEQVGCFPTVITFQYVYANGQRIGMLRNNQGVPLVIINDHLGSSAQVWSTASMSASTRTKYYPYGEVQSMEGTISNYNYRYAGKFREPFAPFTLYNFGARWYDPNGQRFLTPDPVYSDHTMYGYANSSPYLLVDLFGFGGVPAPPFGITWVIDGVAMTPEELQSLYGRDWLSIYFPAYQQQGLEYWRVAQSEKVDALTAISLGGDIGEQWWVNKYGALPSGGSDEGYGYFTGTGNVVSGSVSDGSVVEDLQYVYVRKDGGIDAILNGVSKALDVYGTKEARSVLNQFGQSEGCPNALKKLKIRTAGYIFAGTGKRPNMATVVSNKNLGYMQKANLGIHIYHTLDAASEVLGREDLSTWKRYAAAGNTLVNGAIGAVFLGMADASPALSVPVGILTSWSVDYCAGR